MPRLGFTVALTATVVVSGILTGSAWHELPHEVARRVAFAPIDLRTGSWHRLLSSLAFAGGPAAFWKVLALIAVSCAPYEWRRGTRATMVGFAFLHLATLLAISAIVLIAADHGQAWADGVALAYDVGPSAGCYGCFGLLLAELPWRWSLALMVGFIAVATVNLVTHLPARDAAALGSDLEHALAIVFGLACHAWHPRRVPQRRSEGA